jgi:hypothetical protein
MKIPWSAIASRLPGLGMMVLVCYWLFVGGETSQARRVVVIDQNLGLAGKVTGYNKARGNKIFLNSSDVPYNFDSFENEALAQLNGLGYYLEQGDSVYKSPNAPVVRVVRAGQRSTWHLVLADTTAP